MIAGLTLPGALALAAAAVALVVLAERAFLGKWMIPPLFVIGGLLALAAVFNLAPALVAVLTMVACVIVVIGAWVGHFKGELKLAIPLVDMVIFAALFWAAWGTYQGVSHG